MYTPPPHTRTCVYITPTFFFPQKDFASYFLNIGGLDTQILELKDTILLPLLKPELFLSLGVRPPRYIYLAFRISYCAEKVSTVLIIAHDVCLWIVIWPIPQGCTATRTTRNWKNNSSRGGHACMWFSCGCSAWL